MDGRAPRLAVPLAAALLGFLTVLAAGHPRQALRETRRLEIADLIRQQGTRVQRLRAQVGELRGTLASLARGSAAADRLVAKAARLAALAGPGSVEGPGVVVTLNDSAAPRSPTGDPNDLLVHERDIQAVVNALWASGAEAVSVDGQRLTSVSAVRCAGSTLLLHGQVHSPPYEIAAIGDPKGLATSLPGQPGMVRLQAAVDAFGIEVSVEADTIHIPAADMGTTSGLAETSSGP
jgi:uncharacterized protein YlxW (UPF0749 family)